MPHESVYHRPTAQELARITPPLPGAEPFARELLATLRSRLTLAQRPAADALSQALATVDSLRLKEIKDPGPQDLAYFLWQAEQALLVLLGTLPETITAGSGRVVREIDGQHEWFLVRSGRGGESLDFRLKELDFTPERPTEATALRVHPTGTTWMLVTLVRPPNGTSVVHLMLQPDGAQEPRVFQPVTLVRRPEGQLAVRVEDEQGQPVPVLLRLTAKATGRIYEPPNATDLREMLNAVTGLSIYGPGTGYTVYCFGPMRGVYWIVPGPFSLSLPAGEWEVHVLHGTEYEPLVARIKVASERTTHLTLRLKRWVRGDKRGWYAGDDHVHARLVSSEDATRLLHYARAVDLTVCNVLEMGDEHRTWYPQRGFGPAFRVQEKGCWLVPGQEDPRSVLGHAIGLNLRERVRDPARYLLNDRIAQTIHEQGGLYGHTHVGSGVRALATDREMALFLPLTRVDFASIMQATLGTELYYDFLDLGFQLTATAGSDTPYGGTVGVVRTYAYCGKRFTPDAWFDALRRGQTFVSNGPLLELTVEGKRPGEEWVLERTRPLTARVQVHRRIPSRVRLLVDGKTVAESEKEQVEMTLSLPQGGWVAAHVVDAEGAQAHTTPVYVSVRGIRRCNRARLAEILPRVRTSLREIEILLPDYPTQAEALRERLGRAHAFYNTLEREIQK